MAQYVAPGLFGGPQNQIQLGQPYQYFRATNAPRTGMQSADLASRLMSGYKDLSYTPKGLQSYLPPELMGQLGQATSRLAGYTPEKVDVGRVQNLPASYYQTQVEELSKPFTQQYERSRALARGDQAARGTLYDTEGYRDIGELDKNFLQQLGSITSNVQLQRMAQEQGNEQSYVDRALQEATQRRGLGLQGLTTGAGQLQSLAGMYGDVGRAESQLGTQTALQQAGLDANTINALLGESAERYRTEAGLFGDIYASDVDRDKARRQQLIDMLELQGYQGVPQEQLFKKLLGEYGYPYQDLKEIKTTAQQQADDKQNAAEQSARTGSVGNGLGPNEINIGGRRFTWEPLEGRYKPVY